MTQTETTPPAGRTQEDVVRDLVSLLGSDHFGTGPLAELRRLAPTRPAAAPPALHRLLARYVPEHWLGGDGMQRWTLLAHLLALAAPSPTHGFTPLGKALFDADYNEGRLTALLSAQADAFPVALPRLVRFLVAKGGSPHPYQLANLVLGGGRDADRMAIARDYYRADSAATAAATPANSVGKPAA